LEQFPNNESNNKKVKDKRKPLGILKYIMQKKKTNNLYNEINEYLTTFIKSLIIINPYNWWKNHKLQYLILSKIAKDYIRIPSTSVSSEQVFFKSGELISKKRNRLNNNTIEAYIYLNSWIKLLNN
jgi:hypothetical protein